MRQSDKLLPEILLDSKKVELHYIRQVINSSLLPLWARILPGNIVKLELPINDLEKATKLVSLLENWFENITVKEIEYEKKNSRFNRETETSSS